MKPEIPRRPVDEGVKPTEQIRRPVEEQMASVLHQADPSGKTKINVPIGSTLFNQSISMSKGPGSKQQSRGVLKKIMPSGDLQVETQAGMLVWPADNRIWISKI